MPRDRSLGARALRWVASVVDALPHRVREPAFWRIQAAVLGLATAHLLADGGILAIRRTIALHHIPVILYIAPVAYAGLRYGLEGGVLTAAWSALLSLPNIVLWHRLSWEWLGEGVFLAVVAAMGIVLSMVVEREREARLSAEQASRRLSLLHEVAAALARAREPGKALDDALRKILLALHVPAAGVAIRSLATDPFETTVSVPEDETLRVEVREALAHHRADPHSATPYGVVVVPLPGDKALRGSLAVASRQPIDPRDRDLLDAVAAQVAVGLDNLRLHTQERERLVTYARRVTRAQEEERKRVARELHDEAAQSLVLLCRGLDDLADGRGRPQPPVRRRAEQLREQAGQTLELLRRFSRDLRPAILDDLGLVPALQWLAGDLDERTGICVECRVSGKTRRLPPEAEVAVFRIAQEALHNAERHADASRISVELAFGRSGLRVRVADDGRGLPLPMRARTDALGLVGMRERAELVGGKLSIASRRGRGTSVTARVPAS